MTLSRMIASLTGRVPAATPLPRRATASPSDPNVARLLQSGAVQFVPAKESEHSLGATRDVRQRISDVLPGVAFDDEGRGAFTRTGYSVVFHTGCEDHVSAVRVEVTGGAAAMPSLLRLEVKTGWRLATAGGPSQAA